MSGRSRKAPPSLRRWDRHHTCHRDLCLRGHDPPIIRGALRFCQPYSSDWQGRLSPLLILGALAPGGGKITAMSKGQVAVTVSVNSGPETMVLLTPVAPQAEPHFGKGARRKRERDRKWRAARRRPLPPLCPHFTLPPTFALSRFLRRPFQSRWRPMPARFPGPHRRTPLLNGARHRGRGNGDAVAD